MSDDLRERLRLYGLSGSIGTFFSDDSPNERRAKMILILRRLRPDLSDDEVVAAVDDILNDS